MLICIGDTRRFRCGFLVNNCFVKGLRARGSDLPFCKRSNALSAVKADENHRPTPPKPKSPVNYRNEPNLNISPS